MLVSIRLSYYGADWKALGEEKYAELRKVIPQLPEQSKDYYGQPLIVGHDGLEMLAALNIDASIDKEKLGEATMLTKMVEKYAAGMTLPEAAVKGALVQLHIPNIGLMLIDEVDWLEDACTQQVQDHLNDGWRIIAVCPPNAQRRPDYIFGRTGAKKG